MKKFWHEFKAFALQGNTVNMAVGIIIGAAFKDLINSFTQNIVAPLIGLLGKSDFKDSYLELLGVKITYGAFLTSIIDFLLMALIIFFLVKGMAALANAGKRFHKGEDQPVEPTTKTCPFCLSEVPAAATRCPYCTSHLEAPAEQPEPKLE